MSIKKIIDKIKSLFVKEKVTYRKTNKTQRDLIEEALRSNDESKIAMAIYEESQKDVKFKKKNELYELNKKLTIENNEYIKRWKHYTASRKITFNLIPKQQANRNVRSYLEFQTGSYKKWKDIRDKCETDSNNVCSICGNSSKLFDSTRTTHTECHEEWRFYYKDGIYYQKLMSLKGLCFICHNIKHLNQHTKKKEYFDTLLERYAELNDISIEQAKKDYKICLEEVEKLNGRYKLNLKLIGIEDLFDCHSSDFNSSINGKDYD